MNGSFKAFIGVVTAVAMFSVFVLGWARIREQNAIIRGDVASNARRITRSEALNEQVNAKIDFIRDDIKELDKKLELMEAWLAYSEGRGDDG